MAPTRGSIYECGLADNGRGVGALSEGTVWDRGRSDGTKKVPCDARGENAVRMPEATEGAIDSF